jgi:hypothetical protein
MYAEQLHGLKESKNNRLWLGRTLAILRFSKPVEKFPGNGQPGSIPIKIR